MAIFFITMLIAMPLLLGAALLINYCRRNVGRTRHGLTGMCHESGGQMCGCCSTALQKKIKKTSAR